MLEINYYIYDRYISFYFLSSVTCQDHHYRHHQRLNQRFLFLFIPLGPSNRRGPMIPIFLPLEIKRETLPINFHHHLGRDMKGAVKYTSIMTFKTKASNQYMIIMLIHPIDWIRRPINEIYTNIIPNEIKFLIDQRLKQVTAFFQVKQSYCIKIVISLLKYSNNYILTHSFLNCLETISFFLNLFFLSVLRSGNDLKFPS